MYSEMNRSVLTAPARSTRAPASAAKAMRATRASRTKRARTTADAYMSLSPGRWRKRTCPAYNDRRDLEASTNRPDTVFPAVKRYHVTTFGCQMNAHDSERIKGMLEELGLGETAA